MEILEKLQSLGKRVSELKENIQTEEATKNAFIMPFIQHLGYDVFNPMEVIPEFVADISNKKGEKVDYCIQKDGEPIIIIECKHWQENLDLHNTQLERYFSFTKAKFGILTNGIVYRFYTDIDEANKMDSKPFLELDLENLKETSVNELKKFHKTAFDVDKIFDAAGELKYYNAIKLEYQKEIKDPSDEMVKFFAKKVYNGKLTEKVIAQFRKVVKKALNHKFSEIISDRLTTALSNETKEQEEKTEITEEEKAQLHPSEIILFEDKERGIITTQEEINGYEIVVDILKDTVDTERVVYRDTKTYFGVLLDDNNRKPICRLRFNNSQKYISTIDKDKNEEKFLIERIEHIYKFANKLIETVSLYETTEATEPVE